MSISNYLEGKLLGAAFNNASFKNGTIYGSLHTGDPGETGALNALASCAREAIVFNTFSASAVTNATGVTWTCGATGTISYIGLWDGSATDTANCLWTGQLTANKTVANENDQVTLASGALTVALD